MMTKFSILKLKGDRAKDRKAHAGMQLKIKGWI